MIFVEKKEKIEMQVRHEPKITSRVIFVRNLVHVVIIVISTRQVLSPGYEDMRIIVDVKCEYDENIVGYTFQK